MKKPVNQQIVISGVGGQGVLFITRLLAEAAIMKGYPVFTSETHGMAQRGGTVLSHLKVGNFAGPLIRPFHADGLIALKAENILQHGAFLKKNGWIFVNSGKKPDTGFDAYAVDADALSLKTGNPKSVNLILLGFALKGASSRRGEDKGLFCTFEEIKNVIAAQLKGKKDMIEASVIALEAGYSVL
ncbi:MAG: indolepyruvate ferredoxin oxidoreductase, beta subunit [Thermodesulfobacteriota bacterium]|nr:indolepyruvate ferredoxin oxidoreductase, beta subunit [Thermodesulfobacteriota bacterium]